MDFPIELIKEISGAIKTVTQSVEIARWISDQYQKRRASRDPDENQDDERMDECYLKTLYLLMQESEEKKLEYIKCFAQNTILSENCPIDTDTILSFLMDIEQMTWRQFCLLEGFSRKNRNEIKIESYDNSGINGIIRGTEIKKLIDLNYLSRGSDSIRSYTSTSFDHIHISTLGQEISRLLDLQSVEPDEIGKAFGTGRVQATVTY